MTYKHDLLATMASIIIPMPRGDVRHTWAIKCHQATTRLQASIHGLTVGSLLTDHHAVHCLLQAPKPDRTKKQICYRKYAGINSTKFRSDFELIHLVTSPCNNIADLSQQYDSTLKGLLNSLVPLITWSITVRPNTPWYSNELSLAKRKLRQAERKWRLTKRQIHRDIFTGQRGSYKQQIQYAKAKFYTHKIYECAGNNKALFRIMDDLVKRQAAPKLPNPVTGVAYLADDFLEHFTRKV